MKWPLAAILWLPAAALADGHEKASMIDDAEQCAVQPAAPTPICKMGARPRAALPSNERALLPATGFILWSGGFMSSVGVYAFDAEARRLSFYRAKQLEHALAPADFRQFVALSNDEVAALTTLTNQIWSSRDSFMNERPSADQNVRLILAADDDVKDVSSFGPPRGKLEALFDRVLTIANRVPWE